MESRKTDPAHAVATQLTVPTALGRSAATKTLSFTLPNGLHVIVREDHFAPVVALQAWVKAGGADERDEEAGVAHVHEHMLFKGTARRGVGQIAAEVEAAGGLINAFTTADHTVYHLVLAGRDFATGLDILADALRHSTFDPDELARELKVVLEEWKRSEDMPVSRAHTELFRHAFRTHPYGRPVIGWRETIESLNRARVLEFFQRWYRPNNTVLVVVGDVEVAQVEARSAALLGDWEPAALPARLRPGEPPQQELRVAGVDMPVQEHQLALGFRIPSAHDPDAVPLDLLAYILAGSESTRLVTLLEAQKELVNSVSAFAYTPPDPGLFILFASLERKKIATATRELLGALARVRTELVGRAEVVRGQANLESEFVYRKQTMQGQARLLGYSQCVFADPNYETRYLADLAAVSREDVRRVAAGYLRPENMVAILVGPEATELVPTVTDLMTAWDAPSTRSRTATQHAAGGPPRVRGKVVEPGVHVRTLANGTRLIVKEHHAAPLVAMRAATLGGLLLERRETSGINNFLAGMLTRGSRRHTRESLGRAVDSLAGTLEGFSGRNSFGLRGQFLARHVEEGLELFVDVLRHPTFPADEVEKRRRELLVQLSHRDDDPAQRAMELFYAAHFRHHPYAMPGLGRRATLHGFTRQALAAYHRRLLAPGRLVVSAVGDLDAGWLLDRLEAAFGDLPAPRPLPRPSQEEPPARLRRVHHELDRQQAHFVLGVRGNRITDADRAALKTAEAVLSRQGGRLFLELRDRRGLAYSVSAFAADGVDPGVFAVYFACAPEVVEQAVAGVVDELRRLRDEPLGADELEQASRYLLGSYEISLQTNSAQSDEFAFNVLYGLGVDGGDRYREAVARVTAADVQAVARRYFTLDAYTLAIVGPRGGPRRRGAGSRPRGRRARADTHGTAQSAAKRSG